MNTTVKRTLVGVLFLIVMVGSLLWNSIAFIAVFAFIMLEMMWEFFRMTIGRKHMAVQYAALAVAAGAFVLGLGVARGMFAPAMLALNLVSLVLLMVVMVLDHLDFKDYSYIFTALLYIALPVSLSHFVVNPGGVFDGRLMLSFLIVIWASDTGAYCFGMLLGQKVWPAKLCPEISPKKSWAGAIGGLVASLLAAYILHLVGWLPFPLVHVLVSAAVMNVLGVFGDLFESLWKRQFGIKDSGNIMPGHGGLLDRFDSALFAIPAGYVYLIIMGLV